MWAETVAMYAFWIALLAPTVATLDAVKEARHIIQSGAPVGPYLADQLLIPMTLAKGGSFRTCPLTQHTLTNIDVIKRFIDIGIEVRPIDDKIWHIEIG